MIPKVSKVIHPDGDPATTVQAIASCDYHICERLHGQIISTILGIPVLPIDYDPKNRSFAIEIGLEDYLIDRENLTAESLMEAFEKVLADKEKIEERLRDYAQRAYESALLNRQFLSDLIESY